MRAPRRGEEGVRNGPGRDTWSYNESVIADVLLLAILVAFFALAVLFVRACERIIGPDLEAAAPAIDQPTPKRSSDGARMTGVESVIGLVLSVLVAAYLVYALLFPEKL